MENPKHEIPNSKQIGIRKSKIGNLCPLITDLSSSSSTTMMDATKPADQLGWTPTTSFEERVQSMVHSHWELAWREPHASNRLAALSREVVSAPVFVDWCRLGEQGIASSRIE